MLRYFKINRTYEFLHLLKRSNAAIPFSAESAAKIGGMNILIILHR